MLKKKILPKADRRKKRLAAGRVAGGPALQASSIGRDLAQETFLLLLHEQTGLG